MGDGPLLRVSGLDACYGDFQALFGVDLEVNAGETVAVIGANGAGKSTLLGAIVGQVRVTGGSISYTGADLAGVASHRRVGMGVSLVPEGRRLFPSLTVEENLLIGGHRTRPGPINLEAVLGRFPLLRPLLKRQATKLSGGEQQAIAIGRALMGNPELLLLDEVSLGLAPVVVRSIYEAIAGLIEGGTTIVIVEQDITRALDAADRVYCMLEGRISLHGAPEELSHDDITAAYFGVRR